MRDSNASFNLLRNTFSLDKIKTENTVKHKNTHRIAPLNIIYRLKIRYCKRIT